MTPTKIPDFPSLSPFMSIRLARRSLCKTSPAFTETPGQRDFSHGRGDSACTHVQHLYAFPFQKSAPGDNDDGGKKIQSDVAVSRIQENDFWCCLPPPHPRGLRRPKITAFMQMRQMETLPHNGRRRTMSTCVCVCAVSENQIFSSLSLSLSLSFLVRSLSRFCAEVSPFLSSVAGRESAHGLHNFIRPPRQPSLASIAPRCKYANPDPLAPIPKFSSLSLKSPCPWSALSLPLSAFFTAGHWVGREHIGSAAAPDAVGGGRVCKVECSYPLKSSLSLSPIPV